MKRLVPQSIDDAITIGVLFLTATMGTPTRAQEHTPDQHTLLLLHCDDSLSGAQGETPTQMTGVSFEPGILGSGAYLSVGNQVHYSSAGNISSTEGTLEFWIKPTWNGNDGQSHIVLRYGLSGGMLFGKDGGNFWRSIFNRFGTGGKPEMGTGIFVDTEWQANQWHHCASTWSSDSLKVYVDGNLRSGVRVTSPPLPVVNEATLQLGGDGTGSYLEAVIDELRLSDIARSPEEVRVSFWAGIAVSALTIQPDSLELFETWWKTPTLTASTNLGLMNIPPSAAQWHSANPSIATVNEAGRIIAVSAGVTTVSASYQGMEASVTVRIKAPVLPALVEQIDPDLAMPAADYLFEMPVVILRYFPTTDGVNVDPVVSDWHSTLADLRAKIDRDAIQTKFMLEEGSRFRGYKNPSAQPSLGYLVIHMVTVFEEMPPGFAVPGTSGVFFPDYDQILTRFGAENFVNNLGVKEFWIWGYHHGNIVPPESNMSSPTTGDISNSLRFNDDLPVFERTYTVYGYNFTRGPNENVHNHGHQLEAILAHANWRQDGNSHLFWKKFVGQDASGNFTTGRCGWTHMPPNTTEHYDYHNMMLIDSDIEDWTPDRTGATKLVNARSWGDLAYAWPNNDPAGGQTEAQWYIYWMQNMPGRGNTIRHGQNYMANWWEFTGDWDGSINAGLGLYQSTPTSIKENGAALPASFVLQQNHPNPFNLETEIRFQLPNASHVVLKVFNILGEEMRTLVAAECETGYHRVRWDGKDEYGHLVASGVFFYRLQTTTFSVVKKMILVRK